MFTNTNIFSRIDSYGSAIALVNDSGETITYNALSIWCSDFVEAIQGRPLTLLICNNSIIAISAYVALIKANLPVMLLHHSLPVEQVSHIIRQFKPGYVFHPQSYGNIQGIQNEKGFHDYILSKYNLNESIDIEGDLSLLLTTSGSTGSTKFVRISQQNLLTNTRDIANSLAIDQQHTSITTMPMSYTYGLSIINTHLNRGGTLLASERSIISKDFFQALTDFQVTSFGGVPFIYETLIKLKFWHLLPSSIEYLTQAGGKLNHDAFTLLAQHCNKRDIRFYSMYGQTEATARMSILDQTMSTLKTGSIGKPIGNSEFLIKDEAGTIIFEPHQSGVLHFKGENVSLGYAESFADLNQGDCNQGVLNTGDVGYFDEDGYFYIIGREKRFVKVHGHRVSLDEIESIIARMGVDVAVIGEDDRISIFLLPQAKDRNVIKHIARETRIPKRIFCINESEFIPRLKSGKIDYRTLANHV